MSEHRDFVRDDLANRVQRRIGRIEGEPSVLEWRGLDDFDGRTVFITESHDASSCPFADGDTVPMLVSNKPLVVPV